MRVVLLSGGSGKRLWPLSNEVRSKAFLRLLPAEDGGMESMIELICRGLKGAGLLDSSCIVTHRSQVEITRNHVGGDIPLIAEPRKRGTFTAVALAASYLHSVRKADLREIVAVIPVDSFVEAAFFKLILRFPSVLAKSRADIALIGAEPKSPSPQFGYILPRFSSDGVPARRSGDGDFLEVARFAEKPDEARAERFISRGGLWNCGVFACSLGFLLSCMSERGISGVYGDLLGSYDRMPERSFDVEVLERTRRAVVIPYTGPWEDIGSWDALVPHLPGNVTGLGNVSSDSEGAYLVNELPCPVHVIGVKDVVVAAGPDGILVAGKQQAKRIKEELAGNPARPMIEERRWGISRILDCSRTAEGEEVTASKVILMPGGHTSLHLHPHTREMWSVLSGSGEYRLGNSIYPASAGDVIAVAPGIRHALRAITRLELIVVEIRPSSAVEDIVRVSADWDADLAPGDGAN